MNKMSRKSSITLNPYLNLKSLCVFPGPFLNHPRHLKNGLPFHSHLLGLRTNSVGEEQMADWMSCNCNSYSEMHVQCVIILLSAFCNVKHIMLIQLKHKYNIFWRTIGGSRRRGKVPQPSQQNDQKLQQSLDLTNFDQILAEIVFVNL